MKTDLAIATTCLRARERRDFQSGLPPGRYRYEDLMRESQARARGQS
jgi:hypothetical protein